MAVGTIRGADHGALSSSLSARFSGAKPTMLWSPKFSVSGADAASDNAATRAAERCFSSRVMRHAAVLITSATPSEMIVMPRRMMSIMFCLASAVATLRRDKLRVCLSEV